MTDSKKPDFDVMVSKTVVKDGDSKNYYTTIGAGWNVSKGGISLDLECLPVSGKMVLFPRKNTEKDTKTSENQEAVTS